MPVETGAQDGIAGQGPGAAEDLRGGVGGIALRRRVAGEVVRVRAARLEGGIVARRGDAVGRVVGRQFLELSRHEVLEPAERGRPGFRAGGVAVADLLTGPV